MKCISVMDPWASLLSVGAKAYETRGWEPPRSVIGQRIAIQASKGQDGLRLMAGDPGLQRVVWDALRPISSDGACFAPGCVIAVATLALVIPTDGIVGAEVLPEEKALGDWSPGRFAWRLTDPFRLRQPLPIRGKLGLFDLHPDPVTAIERQIAGVA